MLTSNDTLGHLAVAPAPRSVFRPDDEPLHILGIDDETAFCSLLKESLQPLGYVVRTFTNPVKAVEFYTSEIENIDLVIVDFYMPPMDGTKTCRWLKQLNPNIRIILCSGLEPSRMRPMIEKEPYDGYIPKPFLLADMIALIDEVMVKPPKRFVSAK